MPTNEYYLDQIAKELATAREAQQSGNDGKSRVCSRRAAGQAIAWYVSKHPKPAWGSDALSQLKHLKDDPEFPRPCRDAAARLAAKISGQFTYRFSTDPLEDANIIIRTITQLVGSDAA